jgi:hypothetical protein
MVYAATILLSAFLLFQVQPLIGKIILPWFGGSAAVWSATLMFFQIALLGGYAYAHFARRLRPNRQMLVHFGLLAASLLLLPIIPASSWKPTAAADPTFRILALLTVTVGLPYFLLSSTSPLLQAWYVRRTRSLVPYRFFALSNFGSMLGLLSFPIFVEPRLTSRQQGYSWSALYVGFALLCGAAAWRSREGRSRADSAAPPLQETGDAARPRWGELIAWISLAACASVLLLSVTQHLTQNVAPVPLLWVVPLAVYLLTFILAFESDRVYRRWIFLPLLVPALALMARLMYAADVSIRFTIPAFVAGLFVCCMMCHGELARRRPATRHLTLFYLMVALGGALGGFFVAIVAPRIFDAYLELPLGLVVCAFLAVILTRKWRALASREAQIAILLALILYVFFALGPGLATPVNTRLQTRNFYGALRVADFDSQSSTLRRLYHGSILHGEQLLDNRNKRTPTSYYSAQSGVGRAIKAMETKRDRLRVGVIGLGAGSLAVYGRQGDSYEFYEINPTVERIARTQFSYLADSPAQQQVLLGDARLTLERQAAQRFDLLVVDAFSGDSVPIHLLTREALALYFRHLTPDGILAINVTNRYVDLTPVCASGMPANHVARWIFDPGGRDYLERNAWVLISSEAGWFESSQFKGAGMGRATAPKGFRPWTDEFSNVIGVLRLR